MKAAEFLYTHRVFTRQEFERALLSGGEKTSATLTKHLQLWRRSGRLHTVRRGVYVRLEPGQTPADAPVDALTLASRMAPDAVLAYHTALEAHGVAQSAFERLFFTTWTKARPMRFQGREYVPVRPRSGVRDAKEGWVSQVERAGIELRVTTVERTVVDVLDRPDLAGGVEEVWRSLAAIEALDFDELVRYWELIARPLLTARLGFALEANGERWLTPPKLLAKLEAHRPRGPVYLDRRRPGRLVTRWNLVVSPDMSPSEETPGGIEP